jgi:hypothetical protein
MKNCFKQLPMIFLFSFFLMSCGETIDGSTSDQDYFGSNERRGEEFVFEYKGLPFTGKVKNIKGEKRHVAPFLHDLYYAIPESYSMGDSYYTFKITPEILSFNEGKLEGEYSLFNFKDEEVYVLKFSKGKLISRIKNGIEEDLSKDDESQTADSTAAY